MFRLFTIIAMVFAAMLGVARAENRVALVIGNGAYTNAPSLSNPAYDAADMARTLRQIGFDVVEDIDLDKRSMEAKILEFGGKLEKTDVALFFYAGHSLQVAGRNYLIPIDARLENPANLSFETFDLHQVQDQMEASRHVNLLFLDACRNNPFARTIAGASWAHRSAAVGRGLASTETTAGTMIAYATQPDNVALDGVGQRNSPFTTALLKHVKTPGLEIRSVMTRVRADVMAATGDKQVPWDHSSLVREVILVPANATPQAPAAAEAPSVSAGGERIPSNAGAAGRPSGVSASPPAVPPLNLLAFASARRFKVLENVSDGILNIRASPGTGARVVAEIPAGASDVTVGRCVPPEDGKGVPWCEVQWRGYAGWASACCMVEIGDPTRAFRVLADVSGGILNMRQGPGPNFDVVAEIPANAADVSVGRCRRPEGGGSTPWCEVKWRAFTGWASACCMVDVVTGAYARAEN
jgi:uncharacterized caspase-like protein/uncharacterized protein YraI